MRDKQIDVLKAFGIFFVVLGHTDSIFRGWIFSFHMPLFFFISGFLRCGARKKSWSEFLKGKAKATLLPYAVFFLISAVVCPQSVGLWAQVKGFLLGGGYLAEASVNFPLWYLQLYFLASVVFEGMVRYLSPKWHAAACVLLMPASLLVQALLPGRPAFHINILPVALVFMELGWWAKQLLEQKESIRKQKGNFLLGLLFLALGFLISLPLDTDVSNIRRLTYFPGALCTILGFYMISGLFSPSRLLHYIGAGSLYILGLHSLLWEVSYGIVYFLCDKIGLGSATVRVLLVVCLSIAICCGLKELYFLARKLLTKKLE